MRAPSLRSRFIRRPRGPRDRTPLACLAVVAIAATLNVGRIIPPTQPAPTPAAFWECYFFPWLSWCLPPDPPKVKPIVEPPAPAPACCSDTCTGPCPE